jgi:hypothetical protein
MRLDVHHVAQAEQRPVIEIRPGITPVKCFGPGRSATAGTFLDRTRLVTASSRFRLTCLESAFESGGCRVPSREKFPFRVRRKPDTQFIRGYAQLSSSMLYLAITTHKCQRKSRAIRPKALPRHALVCDSRWSGPSENNRNAPGPGAYDQSVEGAQWLRLVGDTARWMKFD